MRLIDADALSEKLCKTTVFIKDGEVFQRMINDAPTLSAETHDKRTETHSVCSDLIRRSDAIEAVRTAKAVFDTTLEPYIKPQDAVDALSALPSAEAVQGWIPCSERLPINNGCVLVTIDDGIEFGKFEDGEWSIWVCEHWDEWDAKGVTAWMPLPEPYEGGDTE